MSKIHKKASAFLIKTFQMLENDFSQIICWNEQGTGFFINSANDFAQKVLPIYFKHSNLHSFIRQLNMYGFNKKRGNNIQSYYHHPNFLKDNKQEIALIQRKVEKKIIKSRNPLTELSIELQEPQEESYDHQSIEKKMQIVCQSNQFLLIQQITNLNMIRKESIQENKQFQTLISNYVLLQNQILMQLRTKLIAEKTLKSQKESSEIKRQKEVNIETKAFIKEGKSVEFVDKNEQLIV